MLIDKDKLLDKTKQVFDTAAKKFIDITIGKTVVYLLQQKQEVTIDSIIALLKAAIEENRPNGYNLPVNEAKAALEFIQKYSS